MRGPEHAAGPVRVRRLARRTGSRLRSGVEDPLAAVASLADLMLVFATGLLVALVLAWDLARALDPSLQQRARLLNALQSAQEVDSLPSAGGEHQRQLPDGAGQYRSVGQVYRDTISGKMYVVEETP